MILSVVGCSDKTEPTVTSRPNVDVDIVVDESGEIVDLEDVAWYQYRKFDFEAEYQDPHLGQICNHIVAVDETTVTALITGYEITPEAPASDMHMRDFAHFVKYDYTTGERILFVDLSDYNRYVENSGNGIGYYCAMAVATEEGYFVFYKEEDYSTGRNSYHRLEIDESGEIVEDTVPETFNDRMDLSARIWGNCSDGSKVVLLTGNYSSETAPYISGGRLLVYDVLTDEIETCPLGVQLTSAGAEMVHDIRRIDSTHFAVTASKASGPMCLILDTTTMELELLDMNAALEDFDDNPSTLEFSNPTNSFVNDLFLQGEDFVATLDLETMKFVKIFDLNHSNLPVATFENYVAPAALVGDALYLLDGMQVRTDIGHAAFYRIEEQDSNPYAGRILLTASALSREVSIVESELIFRFNESQDRYYIAIDNSYVPGEFDDFHFDYGQYVSDSAAMTAELAVDLMAGDGPDIILDGFEFTELNSSDYLTDLSPYFEDSEIYDNEVYFSNAFELAKDSDGALFQMPIGIVMSGIHTGAMSPSEYTRRGFTFEEYLEFLSNECNGLDPISLDRNQINYFILCFNNMLDQFVQDGEIELNSDAFYALAEFCMNNVNGSYTVDEFYQSPSSHFYTYNQFHYLGFPGLANVDNSLSGLPSIDGRGPQINVQSSIAVAASCTDVNGAVDFINFALNDDSQSLMAYHANSLKRSCEQAYMYHLVEAIALENEVREITDPGEPVRYYTYADADNSLAMYSLMIESASGYLSGDSDISMILYEEMPAYFSGDKSLEEVIEIIEDRAQTVLNERG